MNKMIKTPWLLTSLISTLLLSGCVSPGKNTVEHGDMTMAQIYNQQTGSGDSDASQEVSGISDNHFEQYAVQGTDKSIPLSTEAGDTSNAASVASDNINDQFKLIPNPNITVYIFPHLSQYAGTSVPIPGYNTHFFLYETNHYAMPGEVY